MVWIGAAVFLQNPKILCSVVLFDTLASDFSILGVWLVLYGGHQRPLSGTSALQGAGVLLKQRIAPPDKLHVKVGCGREGGRNSSMMYMSHTPGHYIYRSRAVMLLITSLCVDPNMYVKKSSMHVYIYMVHTITIHVLQTTIIIVVGRLSCDSSF